MDCATENTLVQLAKSADGFGFLTISRALPNASSPKRRRASAARRRIGSGILRRRARLMTPITRLAPWQSSRRYMKPSRAPSPQNTDPDRRESGETDAECDEQEATRYQPKSAISARLAPPT